MLTEAAYREMGVNTAVGKQTEEELLTRNNQKDKKAPRTKSRLEKRLL